MGIEISFGNKFKSYFKFNLEISKDILTVN